MRRSRVLPHGERGRAQPIEIVCYDPSAPPTYSSRKSFEELRGRNDDVFAVYKMVGNRKGTVCAGGLRGQARGLLFGVVRSPPKKCAAATNEAVENTNK